jgi:hypothetical protein
MFRAVFCCLLIFLSCEATVRIPSAALLIYAVMCAVCCTCSCSKPPHHISVLFKVSSSSYYTPLQGVAVVMGHVLPVLA